MIVGKTYDGRLAERNTRLEKEARWKLWFAWRPVYFLIMKPGYTYLTGTGEEVWLQWIYRRRSHYKKYGYWKENYQWEYVLSIPT